MKGFLQIRDGKLVITRQSPVIKKTPPERGLVVEKVRMPRLLSGWAN
jgi:hypothetical protein